MTKEHLIKIPYEKEEHIALWKITSDKVAKNKHIFLTHGTFSNKKVCRLIADFMCQQGYTCWIMEWRNHGESSKTSKPFNFETIGKEDIKLVLDYLFDQESIQKLSCITHSGGGICLTMALIHNPKYRSKIRGIALFGCQAFGAAHSRKNYVQLWLLNRVFRIIGFIPATYTGSPHNESYYTMEQWYDWNLSGQFLGADGFNYTKKMKALQVPVLSIWGAGDLIIAPYAGSKAFLDAFGHSENQFIIAAKAHGFREDYNHRRVLYSKNASEEIYPLVLKWLTGL